MKFVALQVEAFKSRA